MEEKERYNKNIVYTISNSTELQNYSNSIDEVKPNLQKLLLFIPTNSNDLDKEIPLLMIYINDKMEEELIHLANCKYVRGDTLNTLKEIQTLIEEKTVEDTSLDIEKLKDDIHETMSNAKFSNSEFEFTEEGKKVLEALPNEKIIIHRDKVYDISDTGPYRINDKKVEDNKICETCKHFDLSEYTCTSEDIAKIDLDKDKNSCHKSHENEKEI